MIERIFEGGDVVVHAGNMEDHGETQSFLVSSHIMKLASPSFSNMLDSSRRFMRKASDLRFPDDAPKVVRAVLQVMHLRAEDVAAELSMVDLVDIADFSIEHQLTATMAHAVSALMLEHERKNEVNWARCAFIHHTFENWPRLRNASKELMVNMHVDGLDNPYLEDKQLTDTEIPPKLLECIASTRKVVVKQLLYYCYRKVEELRAGKGCTFGHAEDACNMMSLGALHRALRKAELFDPRKQATDIGYNVKTLVERLMAMEMGPAEKYLRRQEHRCDVFKTIKLRVYDTMQNAPDPVDQYLSQQSTVHRKTKDAEWTDEMCLRQTVGWS